MQNGIRAITVPDTRWTRCDMKTTALTANVLANQKARENGAGEAIFVRDGVLCATEQRARGRRKTGAGCQNSSASVPAPD